MTEQKRSILVGTFNERTKAEQAVRELECAGFDQTTIGFAVREEMEAFGGAVAMPRGPHDMQGAAHGVAIGGIAGGILGALTALAIPGVGPALVGGLLWTTLGFAGAGAATGGFLGAMSGLGLSEDEIASYEEALNRGQTLVAVRPGNRWELAEAILIRLGSYDVHRETASTYLHGPMV